MFSTSNRCFLWILFKLRKCEFKKSLDQYLSFFRLRFDFKICILRENLWVSNSNSGTNSTNGSLTIRVGSKNCTLYFINVYSESMVLSGYGNPSILWIPLNCEHPLFIFLLYKIWALYKRKKHTSIRQLYQ